MENLYLSAQFLDLFSSLTLFTLFHPDSLIRLMTSNAVCSLMTPKFFLQLEPSLLVLQT